MKPGETFLPFLCDFQVLMGCVDGEYTDSLAEKREKKSSQEKSQNKISNSGGKDSYSWK